MSLKNFFAVIPLFIFFSFVFACSPKNMAYSDADSWVPENFDPSKTTLLIEYHPLGEKQNNRMINFLDSHFPYSYEIVDSIALKAESGPYSNTKKYPFVIRWKPQNSSLTTTYYDAKNGNQVGKSTRYDWDMYGYFIDRVNNKRYPSTKNTNVFGQLGYEPVFNAIKKKFADKN